MYITRARMLLLKLLLKKNNPKLKVNPNLKTKTKQPDQKI